MSAGAPIPWLEITTVVMAAVAAIILLGFLIYKPPLNRNAKVWLLFGIGVVPAMATLLGNVSGFERSKDRAFCASCHVMDPQVRDAENPKSESLASFHSRNTRFGTQSCYVCHADYGMFGTVTTKLNGMRHMWAYYGRDWSGDASTSIKLYSAYQNSNCMQCHSTHLPGYLDEPEHATSIDDIRKGTLSCATSGCHGPAHKLDAPVAEAVP